MKLLTILLLIFELALFLIVTLFGLIESGLIISFCNSNSRRNFGEKLLYSQYVEEIKLSYNRKFIPKIVIPTTPFTKECAEYQKELIFELKLNNKVTSFSKLFGKRFCIEDSNKFFYNTNSSMEQFTYEYLLKHYSVENGEECPTGTKGCGILDTTGHILCLPENLGKCPLNDIIFTNSWLTLKNYDSYNLDKGWKIYFGYDYSTNKTIFVYNFLSENNRPLSHEWRNHFAKDQYQKDMAKYLNKNKKYLEIRDEFDESYLSFLSNVYDKYYNEVSIPNDLKLSLSDINNTDINNYYKANSENLNIKWYYKNYVGFKNIAELEKFKRTYEYYEGLTLWDVDNKYILALMFFVMILVYFIIFGILPLAFKSYRLFMIFSFYFTILYCIYYMILVKVNTRKTFEMDDIYNEVSTLYDKRLKLKYFIGYVIIFVLQLILMVVLIIIDCCCKKKAGNEDRPTFTKIITFDLNSIKGTNDDIITEGGKENDVNIVKNVETEVIVSDRNLKNKDS